MGTVLPGSETGHPVGMGRGYRDGVRRNPARPVGLARSRCQAWRGKARERHKRKGVGKAEGYRKKG